MTRESEARNNSEDDGERTLSGARLIAFLAATVVVEIAATFETSMIYAIIKKLVDRFGDTASVGWLVSIYLLVGAGAAAIVGRVGDVYGRRSIVIALMAAGALGSIVSVAFDSFWAVLIGRGLQGLTMASLPLCIGLVRLNTPAPLVPIAIGINISGASAGTLAGLLVGGVIVDHYSWRAIFAASAVLALVAGLVVFACVPRSAIRAPPRAPHIVGGLLFVPGIAMLLLAVTNAPHWGWTSGVCLGCLFAGVVILTGWVIHSLNTPFPLLNVRLFLNRGVLVANVAMALLAIGALQITQVFSLLLQQPAWTNVGLGVSATMSALVKAPSNVASLGGGPLVGFMITRIGARASIALAASLLALGWALAVEFHTSTVAIGFVLVLIAFTTTMVYAGLPNVIVAEVAGDRTSEAAGMLVVTRATFAAIGAQLTAVALSLDTVADPDNPATRYPTELAYQITMIGVSVLAAAVALTALFLPGRPAATSERSQILAKSR